MAPRRPAVDPGVTRGASGPAFFPADRHAVVGCPGRRHPPVPRSSIQAVVRRRPVLDTVPVQERVLNLRGGGLVVMRDAHLRAPPENENVDGATNAPHLGSHHDRDLPSPSPSIPPMSEIQTQTETPIYQADEAPPATYTFRRSLLDQEQTYTLEGAEMVVSAEGREVERIPLSAVEEVSLRFHRTRMWTAHQAFVKYGKGRRVVLQDLHFKGIANAESRAASYSAFLRSLHAALAEHGGAVRFRAGSVFNFLGSIVMTVVMLAILAGALLFRSWIVAVPAALILLRLVPIIPRSRPLKYTADRIPQKLLPRG